MSGQSTFLAECSEAADILRTASADSLVVLDELGRGTSTFDGFSLAHGVLRQLTGGANPCRMLFATHYHGIAGDLAAGPAPRVALQHMACELVRRAPRALDADREAAADDPSEEDIIFLYRLADGESGRSYGLQVALLAGVPRPVVRAAAGKAAAMEAALGAGFGSGSGQPREGGLQLWAPAERAALRALRSAAAGRGELDGANAAALIKAWHELQPR